MTLDDKLFTIKYKPDEVSHLKPDMEQCKSVIQKFAR